MDVRARSLLAGIGAGTMLVAAGCLVLLVLSAGLAWKVWPAAETSAAPAIQLAQAPPTAPAGRGHGAPAKRTAQTVAQTGPAIVVATARPAVAVRRSTARARPATGRRRGAVRRRSTARARARARSVAAAPRAVTATATASTPSRALPPGQAKKAQGSSGPAVRKAVGHARKAAVPRGKAVGHARKAAASAGKAVGHARKAVAPVAAAAPAKPRHGAAKGLPKAKPHAMRGNGHSKGRGPGRDRGKGHGHGPKH